ncbi:MAG: response regulator transcription factor [Actinomycetota bacterium]|nr:response regulator transcription factor [Actinomycetota bacterium]
MWRDAVERDLTAAGFTVVGTAADGAKAVRVAAAVRPDVVVMDLQLPEKSGVQATGEIVAAQPATRVLILSASGEQSDVLEAVKAGATGYLVKSASAAELTEAVRRTAAGEATFTAGLAGLLLGEYRRLAAGPTADPQPRLSDRETEVLRLVAKGLTAKQVATRLVLSHRTVQNHVQNAMQKLQVHNRAGLVRYAIEAGLDED